MENYKLENRTVFMVKHAFVDCKNCSLENFGKNYSTRTTGFEANLH